MQILKSVFILLLILGPSTYYGLKGQTAEMGIALAAGAIAAAFLNLDKLQKFKGAGIEVELKQAVKDAQATIENLKEFTDPLFFFAIKYLTEGQTWGGIPDNVQHEIIKKIEVIANENKVDPSVNKAIERFYKFNLSHTYRGIGDELHKYHKDDIEKRFWEIVDLDNDVYPSEVQLRKLFSELHKISDDLEEKIQDYSHYKKYQYPRQSKAE